MLLAVSVVSAATAELPPVRSTVKPVTAFSTVRGADDDCVIALPVFADAVNDIVPVSVSPALNVSVVPCRVRFVTFMPVLLPIVRAPAVCTVKLE